MEPAGKDDATTMTTTAAAMTAGAAARRLAANVAIGAVALVLLTTMVAPRIEGRRVAAERARLTEARPELLLIGNSLVRQDLDEERLAATLHRRVSKLTADGSQSAWWYLALENVAAAAEPPPRVVAIGFQDLALTVPAAATEGTAGEDVRDLMEGEEATLRRYSLEPALGAVPLFLHDHVRLVARRVAVREALERDLRDRVVPMLLRRPLGSGTVAYGISLANQRMDRELLAAYQIEATNPDAKAPEFERALEESLLPEMVAIAHARGLQLVFLRMPRLSDARGKPEHADLTRYVADLAAWLAEREVVLIDLTRVEPLTPADFSAGDHLTPAGAVRVTDRLAERLAGLKLFE